MSEKSVTFVEVSGGSEELSVNNYEDKYTVMKPLILITNDDSISAPGLRYLVDCVKDFGEIYVVAPDEQHSGQSSAFTVSVPLRVTGHEGYEGARVFSVNGTPVDCVKLAMHHIVPRRPDIVLSGVNHGSNAGNSVIYSGTMGAAFEGAMQGIPAVGFSLLHHSIKADFSECTPWVKAITRMVLENGLPEGVALNVNFPAKVKIKGVKVVRSARSRWTEEYKEYLDPHGKPFYLLTGDLVNEEPDSDETDLYWLDRDYASIVPVRADQNAIETIPALTAEIAGLKV